MLTQNATALEMELQIYELNANITLLDQRIAGLTQSLGASNSQITSLVNQVLRLQSDSAFLGLELSVVEIVTGVPSVNAYFVNDTVSVAPSTIMEVTTENPGHNGTLVFDSPRGCPGSGNSVGSSYPTFQYYVMLNSSSTRPILSSYVKVNAPAFSFYFQNVGPSAVGCTFSLLYVDR